MKRILLLSTLFIFIFNLANSQNIIHIDYGIQGLVIDLNEKYSMDINNDGEADFYINSWENELGFEPIYEIGCFVSEPFTEETSWGSSRLKILQEGDIIQLNYDNIGDYLDDDRGSSYKSGEGTAEGWFDNQPTYIGFAVLNQFLDVINGWMKVKLDLQNEQLIVLEYAYHDYAYIGEQEIIVGDRGLVNTQNLQDVIADVSIYPNPTQDLINIDFNYTGVDEIQLTICDNLGKKINSTSVYKTTGVVFDAASWPSGIYFINFNTESGVHTERIIVDR